MTKLIEDFGKENQKILYGIVWLYMVLYGISIMIYGIFMVLYGIIGMK